MGLGEGVGATLLSVMLRMAPSLTPAACGEGKCGSKRGCEDSNTAVGEPADGAQLHARGLREGRGVM
jgi:hypothetical protein